MPQKEGNVLMKGKGSLRAATSPFKYSKSTTITTTTSRSTTSSIGSEESVEVWGGAGTQLNSPTVLAFGAAIMSEAKDGRRRSDAVAPLMSKIQKFGLQSQSSDIDRTSRNPPKLVTEGTIRTMSLLLKARSTDGIGLEKILVALGMLTVDPTTAEMVFRTTAPSTLIQIFESPQTENLAALAVWCLSRIARTEEIAYGLLRLNLGKLLVTKGLKGSLVVARISAWCLGTIICSETISGLLADLGFVTAICQHLRRCTELPDVASEDYCPAIYALARISRSLNIAEQIAKSGSVDILARLLQAAVDPRILLWCARGVGCLVPVNSTDMVKTLLDAGIARGLARIPKVLAKDEVEPLGSLAFAVQRFASAEWGDGTRKSLVDGRVVNSLLVALQTAGPKPFPEVHIELAHTVLLLSDVGGSSIRKEIVNAGGVDILKKLSNASGNADVQKMCNLATTSITGNLWSRNTASAKASLLHRWSESCPVHHPECPVFVEGVEKLLQ